MTVIVYHGSTSLLKNIEAEKLPGQIFFSKDEAVGLLTPKGQVEKL